MKIDSIKNYLSEDKKDEFTKIINQILKDSTNMQSNIKTMKRLNKERKL